MTGSIISRSDTGLELGSHGVLRPGKLRWLRALGWAVALFVIFMLVDAAGVIGQGAVSRAAGDPLSVLYTAVVAAAGLALYAAVAKLAERRWPSELALKPAAAELVLGLVVGAAMMATVMAALVGLGLYEISGPQGSSAWDMVGIAITSGVLEELIMRAIVLRLAMRAFGVWPALALQAALFGAMHLANPNASPVAAAAIALEAGLMLAGFYLLTGRLWMSIGVHAAWNFTQGWVFGAAVSGFESTDSLFRSAPKAGAAPMLSGGAFGPEASVPAMVVGTAVAVLVLYLAARRGNLRVRP